MASEGGGLGWDCQYMEIFCHYQHVIMRYINSLVFSNQVIDIMSNPFHYRLLGLRAINYLWNWKGGTTFGGRRPSVEDELWWKTPCCGRRPLVEDNLRWKTTFGPLAEDDLLWKTTFDRRQPLLKDNLSFLCFRQRHWQWYKGRVEKLN